MSASSGIRVASGSMARPPRPGNWRGKTSMAGAIAFCHGRKTMALPPAWEKQNSLKGAAVSAPLKGNHGFLTFFIIVIRLALSNQRPAFSHEAVWRGVTSSSGNEKLRAALVWMQWLFRRFAGKCMEAISNWNSAMEHFRAACDDFRTRWHPLAFVFLRSSAPFASSAVRFSLRIPRRLLSAEFVVQFPYRVHRRNLIEEQGAACHLHYYSRIFKLRLSGGGAGRRLRRAAHGGPFSLDPQSSADAAGLSAADAQGRRSAQSPDRRGLRRDLYSVGREGRPVRRSPGARLYPRALHRCPDAGSPGPEGSGALPPADRLVLHARPAARVRIGARPFLRHLWQVSVRLPAEPVGNDRRSRIQSGGPE